MVNNIYKNMKESYKEEIIKQNRDRNYKAVMVISLIVFIVQILALSTALISPFTSDLSIMRTYIIVYIAMGSLNLIGLSSLYYAKNKLSVSGRIITYIMTIQLFILHYWAMFVAIADQLQGEEIVVYFFSMLTLAIFVEVVVLELGLLLVIIELVFIFISVFDIYGVGFNIQIHITSIQFICFALVIRYFIGRLRIDNFIKHSELTDINKELEFYSYYDSLSGLYNRRKWEELYIDCYIDAFYNRKLLSVILIDIDFFKEYNDTYGHVEGDNIISSVSYFIKEVFKDLNNTKVARYGGDEFIISSTDLNIDNITIYIDDLKEKVNNRKILNERSISGFLSISSGYFQDVPCDNHGHWNMVINADKKMYNDKKRWR